MNYCLNDFKNIFFRLIHALKMKVSLKFEAPWNEIFLVYHNQAWKYFDTVPNSSFLGMSENWYTVLLCTNILFALYIIV